MSNYTIIKARLDDDTLHKFEALPTELYPENSPRFNLGHEPVDLHLEGKYIIMDRDKPVGRFSFYENSSLIYQDQKTATIGSYECIDDLKASDFLFQQTKSIASKKGYQWLIGPMEGSTWNSYRFSDHNDHPNFFMEPYHHTYYNAQFKAAGFDSISHYISNTDKQLDTQDSELDLSEKRYKNQGALIRSIDLKNYESDLKKIGQLSIDSFKDNFLYTPITINQFVSKHIEFAKYMDPDFIKIIEDNTGQTHAFLFAIHDHFDSSNKSLVIKSIARKIDSPYKGISQYLTGRVTQVAKQKGYKKIVHAMMIHDNHTVSGSAKYNGADYKSYSLYGLRL